ncbi:terpenoid cyclase/Protein prenyltransferase [Phanerochaete sordida]|uniref:Protein farnesyltransferase subunit beta n=1 Tax=Phanerochaete sordida TaxID=48140 RepID=A0A9P3G9E2_9APHY|nr:terpenoid cyclase/Protein prenyltransferase [Phanerochaete sordida]
MTASTNRRMKPTPVDGFPTQTSDMQTTTENVIKARFETVKASASDFTTDGPVLNRNAHLQFLLRNLVQGFPARYISQDASQPWLFFWTLQGFSILGVSMDESNKKRAIETILALQHPFGGFAGGPGQFPHLLPTYAAVCALAIVGYPGENGGWDQIDRKKMYNFFMSLKQPDGSFLVSHHGEVDVRGIYCLLVVATMLNILTPELCAGTPEFISSCQTYEGGFGSASFPDWALSNEGYVKDVSAPRPPLGEAHGGYTFCATASWVLLQPYVQTYYPAKSLPQPRIDLHGLLRWATHMQGTDIELGGFRGRTNKLVDGCYSWWVGGCVVLVEGLLGIGAHSEGKHDKEGEDGHEHAWGDVDDSLFNRKALQEYVLIAGQHAAGGLIDKPPKPADAYHTLYCLSGLSAAQHRVVPSEERKTELAAAWVEPAADEDSDELTKALRKRAFVETLAWTEEEGTAVYVGGSANRVNATHPLTDLTVTHATALMAHFYRQAVPQRAAA